MNRQMSRASKRNGARLMKKGWNDFRLVPKSELVLKTSSIGPNDYFPDKFYLNNIYTVQVKHSILRKGKLYTRAMVRRNDEKAICSWQDIFRIKNEIFGEETEAIQFLPPKSELIDSANLYWFFIAEGE